ncbi:transcription factor TFIIIC [Sulfolobus sp. A20]|uniref:helix-turn-helix transcriptional regulator n=1 Tax=Sulfolobaceae TaxID=118883 RepID=UPI000845E971|nr:MULTISPECIES: transcription factor TFIIIC [unclassified Sulfolobus]TRM78172.1 winged helix-turn-helix domain-containing protein [Sulfolobus sp. A20-N-F8]TRM79379.1 winged helix-turn-helix domain-containing protein [Sulfolobus sp. B5]TRM79973.1 winged helix-turn-helix domain-containing protein [Sulfolobus sp. D5]TRM84139.1 winged helix-turn-helix domain-containing protein [Sulfolobus sp. A20-N-F6]TRM88835.1 winged helix-turn-helix domain-containing protein [Sulfolobus sp. C3]TRM98620.1 wing
MDTDSINYEELIHKKIREMGEKGISQQELAKSMGIPIREVSIIVKKLVEKKLIAKKAVKENGKNVVKLFPINNTYDLNIYIKLESIQDIPCLNCKSLTKCGNGAHVSPQSCGKLSNWILDRLAA